MWIGTQRADHMAPRSVVVFSGSSPTPSPAVAASPGAPPISGKPALSTPAETAPSTAVPAVSLTPMPIVTAAPEAPPRILSATLSRSVASPGDVVSGTVITSSNVASVEARVADYGQSLSKTGVGVFRLTYQVPNVPTFFRRTYSIEVIARNTRGESASLALPITIR